MKPACATAERWLMTWYSASSSSGLLMSKMLTRPSVLEDKSRVGILGCRLSDVTVSVCDSTNSSCGSDVLRRSLIMLVSDFHKFWINANTRCRQGRHLHHLRGSRYRLRGSFVGYCTQGMRSICSLHASISLAFQPPARQPTALDLHSLVPAPLVPEIDQAISSSSDYYITSRIVCALQARDASVDIFYDTIR
jgi:hypothetical protein